MKVTGWIIGCASCRHAALARMPYADAVREAYRQGWRRRLQGGRRA